MIIYRSHGNGDAGLRMLIVFSRILSYFSEALRVTELTSALVHEHANFRIFYDQENSQRSSPSEQRLCVVQYRASLALVGD